MNLDRDALRTRLRALFLDELDEHVVVLNRGLVALEQDPTAPGTAELVNELFRSAHSLKGAAQAADVAPVASLCHALESALGRVRDDPGHAGAFRPEPLFQAVDALAIAGRRLREAGDVGELPVAPIVRSLSSDDAGGGRDDRPAPAPRPDAVPEPVTSPPPLPAAEPVAAPASVAAPARPAPAGVRVPAARLEALLGRAGELVLACERIQTEAAGAATAEAAAAQRAVASARHALTDAVRQAGMVPFGEACGGLDRVTRDVATSAGKQARLEVHGGDVEIDRPILDGLRDPLVHLVRNAVDHGLEPPDARVAAGKEAAGTVTVRATLQGGRVAVCVSDDGAGIDTDAVRAAAARRGIASSDEDDVLNELVLAPGVSTAPLLTEVSGRGVGLDAVRAGVEAVGGSVAVESHRGAGARVTLLVPITRSVLRVVLVAGGGEVVALPTSGILRVVRCRPGDLRTAGDQPVLLLDGRLVPVAWLAEALGGDGGPADAPAPVVAVVVETPAGEAALLVDDLLAEHEAVVKPPPERLAGTPGVLGATVLGNGRVVVVLNPSTVFRMAPGRSRMSVAPDTTETPARPARVLLVDDTLTTRTLERSILENAGYEVVVAVDGRHALDLLEARSEGVDAVVSDVNMPRMDGLELCEAIRSSAPLARLPVVLVTSLASDEDRRRGADAGANAYVAKSEFDQSMLLDALARLL